MNETTFQNEKKAQFLWTGFILSFFVIQAIIWTVAISITSGDVSHAVVSGYDEQALNWDEVKKERQSSADLDWKTKIYVDPSGDIYGDRTLTLELKSKELTPVEDASITLTAYHRGRVAEKQIVVLKQISEGIYSGKMNVDRAGFWQLSGAASKANEKYLIDQRIQLFKSIGGQ